MKNKEISDSYKKQLLDLEFNRNKIEEYLGNFLLNYSKFASSIHTQIALGGDKETLKIFSFQYLSSIITCWETFFRDIFAFLNSIDPQLKKSTIAKLKLCVSDVDSIAMQVDLHGYLAKSFNFQNIEEIKKAMFPIFNSDIFKEIAKYEFETFFPSLDNSCFFSLEKNFPNYNEVIVEAIDLRHKMIHDANFIRTVNLDVEFFQKMETVLLLVPQILSGLLSNKYNLPRFVLNHDGKYYDYLFLINDLICNDWVIASDSNEKV